MKRVRQTLCWLCLIFSSALTAQEDYIAIKSGYNSTILNSSSTTDITINRRHTWHTSLVYSYIFENNRIGYSIEPGYLVKGTRISADTLDYRFNFLSMPIMLDFYPTKNLRISLGPEIAYLINARNIVNDSTKINLNHIYDNRWEVSGTIGASYSIAFFADLGVRYNRSFTPLSASDPSLKREDLFSEYFQVFLLLKIAN